MSISKPTVLAFRTYPHMLTIQLGKFDAFATRVRRARKADEITIDCRVQCGDEIAQAHAEYPTFALADTMRFGLRRLALYRVHATDPNCFGERMLDVCLDETALTPLAHPAHTEPASVEAARSAPRRVRSLLEQCQNIERFELYANNPLMYLGTTRYMTARRVTDYARYMLYCVLNEWAIETHCALGNVEDRDDPALTAHYVRQVLAIECIARGADAVEYDAAYTHPRVMRFVRQCHSVESWQYMGNERFEIAEWAARHMLARDMIAAEDRELLAEYVATARAAVPGGPRHGPAHRGLAPFVAVNPLTRDQHELLIRRACEATRMVSEHVEGEFERHRRIACVYQLDPEWSELRDDLNRELVSALLRDGHHLRLREVALAGVPVRPDVLALLPDTVERLGVWRTLVDSGFERLRAFASLAALDVSENALARDAAVAIGTIATLRELRMNRMRHHVASDTDPYEQAAAALAAAAAHGLGLEVIELERNANDAIAAAAASIATVRVFRVKRSLVRSLDMWSAHPQLAHLDVQRCRVWPFRTERGATPPSARQAVQDFALAELPQRAIAVLEIGIQYGIPSASGLIANRLLDYTQVIPYKYRTAFHRAFPASKF